MNKQIFREYDIRGVVGCDYNASEIPDLTKAIVSYILSKDSNTHTLVIGRDGREHSQAIFESVVETLISCGINVIDIGLCPTPVFYFSLHKSSAQSGFIITASHNPREYNGFKMCLNRRPIYGENIQEIYNRFENKDFLLKPTKTHGTISSYNANAAYISWLKKEFAHLKNLDLSFLIDCGNGAAGAIIPHLVHEMGWKGAELLFETIDGTFPNHEADPTKESNMAYAINTIKLNDDIKLGIGFDGDCDRMCPITETGRLVNGDELLALFSKQVLAHNPGATIVFDIKSSSSLIELLERWGARGHIAPTGHSLIKGAMLEHNALLAGEMSCHFFFKDRYFGYDDGIYAMMRLLEIMHENKLSLTEQLTIIPSRVSSPEYRISCPDEKKKAVVEAVRTKFLAQENESVITIDGIRVHKKYGWGLLRASNTQPVLCLRFESDSSDGLTTIKHDFIAALAGEYEQDSLAKTIDL